MSAIKVENRPLAAPVPAESAPDAAPAKEPVEVVPLQRVLAQISRDARRDPKAYLEETRVPGGGE